MKRFLYFLSNGRTVLVFFFLALLFPAYLFPSMTSSYQLPGDPDVFDLQLSFSVERFNSTVQTWMEHKGPGALDAFRRVLVVLDIAFPVVYAILFASLYAWLIKMTGEPVGAAQRVLLVVPFIAGVADLVENSIHYVILADVQQPADLAKVPAAAVFAASSFAAVKFGLLVVSLVVSVIYGLRLLFRRRPPAV